MTTATKFILFYRSNTLRRKRPWQLCTMTFSAEADAREYARAARERHLDFRVTPASDAPSIPDRRTSRMQFR